MRKAILLDRDGVINRERGDYTYRIEDFKFVPGIIEFLKKKTEEGFLFSVVTNQGGIAKGRYTLAEVHRLHNHIESILTKEGVKIEKWWICPHHDQIANCICRKPKSLMVEKALHNLNIVPENAVMIGDSERDVIAAKAAGVAGIKINSNELPDNLSIQIDGLLS